MADLPLAVWRLSCPLLNSECLCRLWSQSPGLSCKLASVCLWGCVRCRSVFPVRPPQLSSGAQLAAAAKTRSLGSEYLKLKALKIKWWKKGSTFLHVSLMKAGISECVCILIMSRSVHPVGLTRGGCVAADQRECRVTFGELWTRPVFLNSLETHTAFIKPKILLRCLFLTTCCVIQYLFVMFYTVILFCFTLILLFLYPPVFLLNLLLISFLRKAQWTMQLQINLPRLIVLLV